MTKELEEQIKILKEFNITDYTIKNDRIIINSSLDLSHIKKVQNNFLNNMIINNFLDLASLKNAPENFLNNTIIQGCLDLNSIKRIPDNFLNNVIINGCLYLSSLKNVPKNFLKNSIIKRSLNLNSIKKVPENFLKDTIINGDLYLRSLDENTKKQVKSNVKKLEIGYNKEKGYCFFDGILRKVIRVSNHFGYTIYHTPFDFVVQKDNFTAHSKTVKQGILDVEFKIARDKVQKEPIHKDTLVTVEMYRMITGACDVGVQEFLKKHKIPFDIIDNKTKEKEPMKAKKLLKLLKKTNAYGFQKFKELVTF